LAKCRLIDACHRHLELGRLAAQVFAGFAVVSLVSIDPKTDVDAFFFRELVDHVA